MDTRTNIVLDDELVAKAMAKAGVTTKKAAIDTALRAYVREPDWQGLLALAGSGVLADDYDPAGLFADAPARVVASEARAAYRAGRQTPVKTGAKAAVVSAARSAAKSSAATPATARSVTVRSGTAKPATAPRRK